MRQYLGEEQLLRKRVVKSKHIAHEIVDAEVFEGIYLLHHLLRRADECPLSGPDAIAEFIRRPLGVGNGEAAEPGEP